MTDTLLDTTEHTIDYDALGPQLIGRRAVHIKHGEGVIKEFGFDPRNERYLLSISLLENETRDMNGRMWRTLMDGVKPQEVQHIGRRHHGALTFKIPAQLLIEGNDRYGWCLIPEQPENSTEAHIVQERILDSIVNLPLTLNRETLVSNEPRLETARGPQPGYYLGYLDLDSEVDMVDHLVHGIDFTASAAIGYLDRGSRKANHRWVSEHLTGETGDLWEGIFNLGLRDDIKESFARILVMLTKSGVEDRDNAEDATSFARRIVEATEQRILGYLGDEIALLRDRSAA